MRKNIFLYFIIFPAFLIFFSCSSTRGTSSKKLPGNWQIEPIVIDGNNKDWPSPYPEYDSKAMLGYTVSNDKDNLYITVETGDLATQLKILVNGLTVWIDKTGAKQEVMAINYPIPIDAKAEGTKTNAENPSFSASTENTRNREQKMRILLEDKVRKLLSEAKEYSLQGFKACNMQYPILETDSCGIKVRIAIDSDNEMVWEAVIPFKTFYIKHEIDKRDKGKPLSVCFETTEMKRPQEHNNGHQNRGGGGFRPSVGMGGMGMRGGMGGGNRGAVTNPASTIMESAYKSTKTWKKFGIAYPN